MKLNIKKWFLGDKKENYRQILKKEGRIGQLEERVMRQKKLFQEIQAIVVSLTLRIIELERKNKGYSKNG